MTEKEKTAASTEEKEVVKNEYEYQGMSLRHEHVANDKLPQIRIFYGPGLGETAQQVGYGIEEEGLPYILLESSDPQAEAQADIITKGLGVAIGIDEKIANVFNRQLKKEEPFLHYEGFDKEKLRTVGKNGARIIKHKPFILED